MDDEKLDKLLEYIKPINSFENTEHPLAPDYSNLDNWAAYPEKDGQQFYLPDSSLPLNKNNNGVDVFYIHPTGFFEKTWNSFMEKNRAAYERTEMMLGNQVSAFNDSCNIYAPEYRQATYYSYFAKNSDGMLAHDLAFEDILNSFNYFIEKTLEAGIVLEGWELKSIRAGKIQIQDSFVTIKAKIASTQGILINPLSSASSHIQPNPSRSRKLLLHQKEIDQLRGAIEKKGKTIVIISLYWKKNLVKIEIGIGRGKKLFDKRQDDKAKDWKIQQSRILKHNIR